MTHYHSLLLKIVNVRQSSIYEYENTKRKLLICNANIYFNQQCRQRNLIPNYAKIKIPGHSHATKPTLKKVHFVKIREEIKFLYKKKQYLNSKLYHTHLTLANSWGKTWQYIQSTTESKLKKQMHNKYNALNH